jgi:hypothetical protein
MRSSRISSGLSLQLSSHTLVLLLLLLLLLCKLLVHQPCCSSSSTSHPALPASSRRLGPSAKPGLDQG